MRLYSSLSAGAESPRDCLSIFCPLATLGHRAGNWAKLDIIITIWLCLAVAGREGGLVAGAVFGGGVGEDEIYVLKQGLCWLG